MTLYYWHLQAVLLNQKEGYDKLSFSRMMFYELVHFKEYQKIYAKNDNGNQDKFKDREEVFDLFAKSLFTGNIIGKESWGRLMEETFGKGTLREFMEKDSNLLRLRDLREFVDNLKQKID